MSFREDRRSPHQIIEAERRAYLETLPPPNSNWPVDVRILYGALRQRLFQEGVRVDAVRKRCGLGNHNISSRFKWHVGRAPKRYILYHRMALAKQLLQYEQITVTQVAFGIGYGSPNAFSATFKRWVSCPPNVYQSRFDRK